jgi:TRAP transporter TAXI family solute receptor
VTSRRRWTLAIALIAATVAAGMLLLGPAPPTRLVVATGQPGGMYAAFGTQYEARLERVGLRTTTVSSTGSLDNLARLLRGEVDVAFVQSGTYAQADDRDGRLRGIAALYFEPVWVFHRLGPDIDMVSVLNGRRISVGPVASGTSAVATALLREHGISASTAELRYLSNVEAASQLQRGALDVMFMVSSFRDPLIMTLLASPGVRLFTFRRERAYAVKFPALTPIKLPEGVLDLYRNLPPHDTMLLAPAALLVCRRDLHPRVVEQILKVAKQIHAPGSLLDPPLRFPTLEGVDVPVHEAAQVYLTQGESLLSRMLPYPLLRWTSLLRLAIISAIVYIPVMRLLPEVATWRVERRFGRMYGKLRDADRALTRAQSPAEIAAGLAALDRLSQDADVLCEKITAARQRDVYHWRMHVAFVRGNASERLAVLEQRASNGVRT